MWPFRKKEDGVYKMCKAQPVQLDCRKTDCIWHTEGRCTNLAPAITLNESEKFYCWSHRKIIPTSTEEGKATKNDLDELMAAWSYVAPNI
jgi:hypothetical protein